MITSKFLPLRTRMDRHHYTSKRLIVDGIMFVYSPKTELIGVWKIQCNEARR